MEKIKKGAWEPVVFPHLGFDEHEYLTGHGKKFALVKKLVEELKPKKIIDIGIATGMLYSLLDMNKYEVEGVDIVPDYIEVLRKRGIPMVMANVEKEDLPYDSGTFDLAICDSILEHTLKPKRLITETARVLKPNGHLIVVVPNATSLRNRWAHLRGRNLFWPLINNLYSKDYLIRCSVLYSPEDLQWILQEYFTVNKFVFLDETGRDIKAGVKRKEVTVKYLRILNWFFPKLRDVAIVVAQKHRNA